MTEGYINKLKKKYFFLAREKQKSGEEQRAEMHILVAHLDPVFPAETDMYIPAAIKLLTASCFIK